VLEVIPRLAMEATFMSNSNIQNLLNPQLVLSELEGDVLLDRFALLVRSVSRSRYLTEREVLFANSLDQLQEYRKFLSIILERYRSASTKYADTSSMLWNGVQVGEGGKVTLDDEQRAILEETVGLGLAIRLEIETFYLFAKILLDRITYCIQFCFGEAQGISLRSHHKLVSTLDLYAKAKRMTLPTGLQELVSGLQEKIVVYPESWTQEKVRFDDSNHLYPV
jgi:hypothetical protein